MKPEWTVIVIDRGRETLILRARSRITGRIKEKKSQTTKQKPAEREAGEWAAELNRVGMVDDLRFEDAAERFEDEYAASRRAATQQRFRSTFSMFKKLVGNPLVRCVNESVIAEFSREYGKGRSVASLASTLRHLKVFLRWCYRQRLLPNLPHIEMPRNATKAGGEADHAGRAGKDARSRAPGARGRRRGVEVASKRTLAFRASARRSVGSLVGH